MGEGRDRMNDTLGVLAESLSLSLALATKECFDWQGFASSARLRVS